MKGTTEVKLEEKWSFDQMNLWLVNIFLEKSLNETKEMCQAVATATSYYVRNDNYYMWTWHPPDSLSVWKLHYSDTWVLGNLCWDLGEQLALHNVQVCKMWYTLIGLINCWLHSFDLTYLFTDNVLINHQFYCKIEKS